MMRARKTAGDEAAFAIPVCCYTCAHRPRLGAGTWLCLSRILINLQTLCDSHCAFQYVPGVLDELYYRQHPVY
jgi:hypothetical protein